MLDHQCIALLAFTACMIARMPPPTRATRTIAAKMNVVILDLCGPDAPHCGHRIA